MKHLIIENLNSCETKYNAGSKARNDTIQILKNLNFNILPVNTKKPNAKNTILKLFYYFRYKKNSKIFQKELSKLFDKDSVFIQYPLTIACINLDKILKQYNRSLDIIILIHDLDSIRRKFDTNTNLLQKIRFFLRDKNVLKSATYIISHNAKMTKELINLGADENKIINLEIFDYIYDGLLAKVEKNSGIIIAGNLEPKKAGYLSELKNLKNVNFNLYGANFDDKCLGENISYKGKFLPDELIPNLEGSFGLVWDGNALDKCNGAWGEYLKFNNPHKTSLYIAAGLPVIIWKKAALSEFIVKNNLGIAVDSLYELEDRLKNISDEEYAKMLDSVKVFSQKIRNGEFLKNALAKIIKD
ncbi:hypothetical protein OFO10_02385 [Campylobacter sp. VBCF_06 NA8]|uniref:hypothetical protein n=1 Tax=Campylobacter sp. VBCF_06 NA8 TaxID=2983822 RepID=UPI0022E9F9B6|nr:hypothetical protein [Campylobacter sp. VBCF_06 NA8]MDA3046003.1 hypothetical protein [Campylobacter sp. VBCF_06 NA8]